LMPVDFQNARPPTGTNAVAEKQDFGTSCRQLFNHAISPPSRGAPVDKPTIDAINELAEKIWDLEGDLLEALSLF
jgi:hypothetical protein